jgi:hypothetical protein
VIRMGLPPSRIADSRLAVGTPDDYLAGRPTLVGDPEHDLLSQAYLGEAQPVRDRATVLVLEAFNQEGYEAARARGTEAAPGVVQLAGPEATLGTASPSQATPGPGPAALVLLSIGSLAALWVLGAGWAWWAFPGASPAAAALAPSAGLAAGVLGGVLGGQVAPGGPWGLVLAVALAAAGHGLWFRDRLRSRPSRHRG